MKKFTYIILLLLSLLVVILAKNDSGITVEDIAGIGEPIQLDRNASTGYWLLHYPFTFECY